MDIFEYLPQLIIAYDGNDKFANLIHVKKANKENDYFCPCCGGIVKPRALDSNKEQSHYYHKTGKCTKESQLHFFCKNWLFEEGSKFYIDDKLFEVLSIDIEKSWDTPFGQYKPDVTVYTTSGETIYFEMFFTNRKTGDDYFCKWNYLDNSVVEINIKEYIYKTDNKTIPIFNYLYHNGICCSKSYIKRDLYATTIGKTKRELKRQEILNYKARIERLDWFWQEVQNNSKENILSILSNMEYDDMVSCYEIIKRKQCISYLKDEVLKIINKKVIEDIRNDLNIPFSEDVYFDLEHIRGRTYQAGIRLNIKTKHILYNEIFWDECSGQPYRFNNLKEFPRIVFSKTILNKNEVVFSEKDIVCLNKTYEYVCNFRERLLELESEITHFEKDIYKIKLKNDACTVLMNVEGKFELLVENQELYYMTINNIKDSIKNAINERKNKEFLNELFLSEEYKTWLKSTKKYKIINIKTDIKQIHNDIKFYMSICNKEVFNEILDCRLDDFNKKTRECQKIIDNFINKHSVFLDLIQRINNCANKFWKAEFNYSCYGVRITINQRKFPNIKYWTSSSVHFSPEESETLTEDLIIKKLEKTMHEVLKDIQIYGYRVMEVKR